MAKYLELVKSFVNEPFARPPIPKGYQYDRGKWHNGFVIKRRSDGSQFTWVPVGALNYNGTLKGVSYEKKLQRQEFGYRHYEWFEKMICYEEKSNKQIYDQYESVHKYGGFYVSSYLISLDSENNFRSIPKVFPIAKGYPKYLIRSRAEGFEFKKTVTSHLVFGAEYDTILQWFIESGARSFDEIVNDSTSWGNYSHNFFSKSRLWYTGVEKMWETNEIYDLAGNVRELTLERGSTGGYIVRGGTYLDRGDDYPVSARQLVKATGVESNTGFRIALCIK